MWSTPQRMGPDNGPMDATNAPGKRLFARQPTVEWWPSTPADDGRNRWLLSESAAGVSLFSMYQLPVEIKLNAGYTVELAVERVPDANFLDLFAGTRYGSYWWLDMCLVLRVRRYGTVVAEARRQHEVFSAGLVNPSTPFYADAFGLSAGFFVDVDGSLALYAHAWDIAPAISRSIVVEESPEIASATLYGSRQAGPFGRGLSLLVENVESTGSGVPYPTGPVFVTGMPVEIDYYNNTSIPARSWFAHRVPLEDRAYLVPDATPIAARPADRLAWGRDRALVAAAPLGWGLSSFEAEGHPEWVRDPYGPDQWVHHPGASRLFDGGRPAALLPASTHRSNVSADDAANVRLKVLELYWDDLDGWGTGKLTLPLTLGAWNEYRPVGWLPVGADAPATFTPPGLGEPLRTVTGLFAAVQVCRVAATNLGGITSQADAVQVERLVLRVAVVCRCTATVGGLTTTEWRTRTFSRLLGPSAAADLLAGNVVAFGSGNVIQFTYPTTSTLYVPGVLTVKAVGV